MLGDNYFEYHTDDDNNVDNHLDNNCNGQVDEDCDPRFPDR